MGIQIIKLAIHKSNNQMKIIRNKKRHKSKTLTMLYLLSKRINKLRIIHLRKAIARMMIQKDSRQSPNSRLKRTKSQ